MPVVLKPDKPSLPPEMLTTFIMATISFLMLSAALMRVRYRYTLLQEAADKAARGIAAAGHVEETILRDAVDKVGTIEATDSTDL